MQSMTPIVAPASGPKPVHSTYLRRPMALVGIPAGAFFLAAVVATAGAEWGVIGVVLGLALFPVTLLVVPIYAGIAHGEWLLIGLMAVLIAGAWLFHLYGREARSAV
jgi:hypothetical protein